MIFDVSISTSSSFAKPGLILKLKKAQFALVAVILFSLFLNFSVFLSVHHDNETPIVGPKLQIYSGKQVLISFSFLFFGIF